VLEVADTYSDRCNLIQSMYGDTCSGLDVLPG